MKRAVLDRSLRRQVLLRRAFKANADPIRSAEDVQELTLIAAQDAVTAGQPYPGIIPIAAGLHAAALRALQAGMDLEGFLDAAGQAFVSVKKNVDSELAKDHGNDR